MPLTEKISLGRAKSWKAPKLTFAKQLGPASFGKAGINVKTQVYDEVTPALNYINDVWPPAVRKGLLQAGYAMKQAVRDTYFRNRMAYINHPVTLALKGPKPPLEESGSLRDAMSDMSGVGFISNPAKAQVKVSWELPESGGTGLFPASRKNDTFEYIWAQEFGSSNMKTKVVRLFKEGATPDLGTYQMFTIKHTFWSLEKRPFFVEGMQKGAKNALGILVANMAPVLEEFRNWRKPYYRGFGLNMAPDVRPPGGMQAMAWYFVPPSSAYKYIGIAADLHGLWDASFSERAVWGYIRQYSYGQGGMTRKSIRRRFRRKVYY